MNIMYASFAWGSYEEIFSLAAFAWQCCSRGKEVCINTCKQLLTPTVFIHAVSSEHHVLLYSTTGSVSGILFPSMCDNLITQIHAPKWSESTESCLAIILSLSTNRLSQSLCTHPQLQHSDRTALMERCLLAAKGYSPNRWERDSSFVKRQFVPSDKRKGQNKGWNLNKPRLKFG